MKSAVRAAENPSPLVHEREDPSAVNSEPGANEQGAPSSSHDDEPGVPQPLEQHNEELEQITASETVSFTPSVFVRLGLERTRGKPRHQESRETPHGR